MLTREELVRLQREFNDSTNVTDERRVEIIEAMREESVRLGMLLSCLFCKKVFVFGPWSEPRAVCEGHIYSDAGYREARITRVCEFCFDKMHEGDES